MNPHYNSIENGYIQPNKELYLMTSPKIMQISSIQLEILGGVFDYEFVHGGTYLC